MGATGAWALAAVNIAGELALFAGLGILLFAISDIAIDLLYFVRRGWRATTVYRRHARATVATLPPPPDDLRVAIFVPAWDEEAVIAPMLATMARRYAASGVDWHAYVGFYANDPATEAAIRSVACARVTAVRVPHDGPTTKGDCLNALWRHLVAAEASGAPRVGAVMLHDAEDVVHRDELRVLAALTGTLDLMQLPVVPLPDPGSRWIAGTYLDEFAESHGKTLVVREALGAGVPAAGVGCGFARRALDRVAAAYGGVPFAADALTEDYELGLRIAATGGRSGFVRIRDADGALVAVHAHFPATIEAAVAQKSRWIAGIALHGWDRMGWQGGLAERWMRLDDRRAPVAALVIAAAYAALVAGMIAALLADRSGIALPPPSAQAAWIAGLSALVLVWRIIMRFGFVAAQHGWREGMRSIPRSVVANVIALMAARRAVMRYVRARRRQGRPDWGKTAHVFPALTH